ncbi:transposase [Methylohalobius crimeensis]|uniref:transposase n=1 Tax=Methylohalobius crimeensis TaxID=244365 RepID=UPI000420E2DF|nr:transposase [Methylohalobius crimeensis]
MWCIPPKQNAAFVCAMERVLEVYKRPFDPDYPVVCMDETSVQCVREGRPRVPGKPGQIERYDVEYERNGVAHLIQFYAPFRGWRRIEVADNHAAPQWAEGVRALVEKDFPDARRITLVMDNLSTHTGASLYKAFEPQVARALLDKLEFVYTPSARLSPFEGLYKGREITTYEESSSTKKRFFRWADYLPTSCRL